MSTIRIIYFQCKTIANNGRLIDAQTLGGKTLRQLSAHLPAQLGGKRSKPRDPKMTQ